MVLASLNLGSLEPSAQVAWLHLLSTALRLFRNQDAAVIEISGLHQVLSALPRSTLRRVFPDGRIELADAPCSPRPDAEFIFLADSAGLSRKLLRRFSRLYITPGSYPVAVDPALYVALQSWSALPELPGLLEQVGEPHLDGGLEAHRLHLVPAAPRVTLITSVFDGDAHLAQFLMNASQLQGYDDCQHLMIRAGSPGNEHEPLLSHVSRFPSAIYINLPQDPGLYEVWNLGVRMATGRYLSNANLDDRRAPEHLERLCTELDERPDVDVVSSPMRIAQSPNTDWAESADCELMFGSDAGRRYDASALFKEVDGRLQARDLPHCMPVWRRELHARHGFFDEAASGTSADWEFWLRAGEGGAGFLMVDEPLGVFLKDPSCYSRRDKAQVDRDAAIAERYRHVLERRVLGGSVDRRLDGDCLRRLRHEGAALELVAQLALRAEAREAMDATACDRLVRELTGLSNSKFLEPLYGLDQCCGAVFWGRLLAFAEGLARQSWPTGDGGLSLAVVMPVLESLCMDALEMTGDPKWLTVYARLLRASGREEYEQVVLSTLNRWNRFSDRRAGHLGAAATRSRVAGEKARSFVLRSLRRLVGIRNVR